MSVSVARSDGSLKTGPSRGRLGCGNWGWGWSRARDTVQNERWPACWICVAVLLNPSL